MKFNLWYEGECEEQNVDVGTLLRWLGELHFDMDVTVDISIKEGVEL